METPILAATKQDELIGLVEDALGSNVAIEHSHRFLALRKRDLSAESLNELQHAEHKRREQQSTLQRIRQLVDKRAKE